MEHAGAFVRSRVLSSLLLLSCGAGCLQSVESASSGDAPAGYPGQEGRPLDAGETGLGDAGVPGTGPRDAGDAGPRHDAGVYDAGVPLRWTWARHVPVGLTGALYAVHGRSASEVYVAGAAESIWRFDGTNWFPVFQGGLGGKAIRALWVSPDGAVFAGSEGGHLLSCLANCTTSAAFTVQQVPGAIQGLCGKDRSTVFATAQLSYGDGRLYRFDGARFGATGATLPSSYPRRCWVTPRGHALIGAQSGVVRFDGSTAVQDPVDWPSGWTSADVFHQYFHAVWGFGELVFATGSRRRVLELGADGRWRMSFNPNGVSDNLAMFGTGPTEALASGVNFGSNLSVLADGGWAYAAQEEQPEHEVFDLWSPGPGVFYAVGEESRGGAGVLLVGRR